MTELNLRYWTMEELQHFMIEHGLVIATGLGTDDQVVITGRGLELFLALKATKELEEIKRGDIILSKPPVPAEVFEKYPGKWVALRGGKVIAVADSVEELSQNPLLEPRDAFFKVPADREYWL